MSGETVAVKGRAYGLLIGYCSHRFLLILKAHFDLIKVTISANVLIEFLIYSPQILKPLFLFSQMINNNASSRTRCHSNNSSHHELEFVVIISEIHRPEILNGATILSVA